MFTFQNDSRYSVINVFSKSQSSLSYFKSLEFTTFTTMFVYSVYVCQLFWLVKTNYFKPIPFQFVSDLPVLKVRLDRWVCLG